MLICSFATPSYSEHAERLRASCKLWQYRCWIERIHHDGPWEHICALKADFIAKALFSSGGPVLWLDADAEIKRRLEDIERLEYNRVDFAVFRDEKRKSPKHHFRSGTVWFNHTDAAIWLLAQWVGRCEEDPDTWDQKHLYEAWEAQQARPDKVVTHWLPESYCKIFDRGDVKDPHIVHMQASRTLKNKQHA